FTVITYLATIVNSTLSLLDALPICAQQEQPDCEQLVAHVKDQEVCHEEADQQREDPGQHGELDRCQIELERQRRMQHFDVVRQRSEEHTSELQSRFDLVCCLLLETK